MKQSYLLGVERKTGMLTPPNGSRTKSPRQNPPEQNPLDKIPLDKIPPRTKSPWTKSPHYILYAISICHPNSKHFLNDSVLRSV